MIKRIWKTKTGEKLNIRDMETRHVQNCLKMLRRFNDARTLNFYLSGSMLQGEQAGYAFDDACRDLAENGWRDSVDDYIFTFDRELERRKEADNE